MVESNGSEVHPKYGKLLYKMDSRTIRESIGAKGTILMIVGFGFLLILLLQLLFVQKGSADGICLMLFFGIIGCVSIVAGIYEAARKNNIRFELYEHGYVDHYYGRTGKRSGPVDRYNLKNNKIYGVSPLGRNISILSWEFSPSMRVFSDIVKELTLDGEPEAEDIYELLEPDYSEKNFSITIPDDSKLVMNSIRLGMIFSMITFPFLFLDLIFTIFLWTFEMIFVIVIGWVITHFENPKRLPNKFIITDDLIIALLRYDEESDTQQNKILIQIDLITKCVISKKRWKRKVTIYYPSNQRDYLCNFSAPHEKDIEPIWDRFCRELSNRVPSGTIALKK